ncbi:hypothetical protein AB6A23_22885 [Paenibacillus tarimensis]
MDPVLERILTGLQDIRKHMATKNELQQLRDEMKEDLQGLRNEMKEGLHGLRNEMKEDLQELRGQMATKDELQDLHSEVKEEMNIGFTELKQLMMDYHLENIAADEKLLDAIFATNHKLDHIFRQPESNSLLMNMRSVFCIATSSNLKPNWRN